MKTLIKVKLKLAVAVLAPLLLFAFGFGGNLAYADSYGVDMNVACQYTLGYQGAEATLVYPNAWGWRCFIQGGGGQLYSVNVQLYCQDTYGLNAVALDPNNPYSWRCQ